MFYLNKQTCRLKSYATLHFVFLALIVLQSSLPTNGNGFDKVIELVSDADGGYDDALLLKLAKEIDDMNDTTDKIKGYLIFGAVLCDISGREEQAQAILKRIPRMKKNLTSEFKALVDETIDTCGSGESNKTSKIILAFSRPIIPGGSGVDGKGDVGPKPSSPGVDGKGNVGPIDYPSSPIVDGEDDVLSKYHSSLKMFSAEDLKKRLYKKSQRQACIDHIENIVGPTYIVKSSGDFVIALGYEASAQNILEQLRGNEELAHNILEQLNDVLKRFCGLYDMEAPENLIVVYLVRNNSEMVQIANKLHGVEVSRWTFGYTFNDDSSIVIRRTGGLGTFGHEVFHALLNHNFAEAPPWLNEGMASLYEEYRIFGDRGILGTFRTDHWRLNYLPMTSSGRVSFENIPTIEQIIRMDWNTFDALQSTRTTQINHLTAKLFAMFLQEKHLLNSVFRHFREIRINDIKENIENFEIHLLEKVCEKKLNNLQREFNEWLNNKLQGL